uniref:Uncharacterized protein n=1 Tax=Mastacembelus armatus TaxID=205130 RepID=A0A3Q3LZS4_9TELE
CDRQSIGQILSLSFIQMNLISTTGPAEFSPASIAIVVEDDLVMSDIPRFADAFALLFGLMYALHLDYPRKLTYTFTLIQKVLLGLDNGKPLKPCLYLLVSVFVHKVKEI